jgi:hypothetical protein
MWDILRSRQEGKQRATASEPPSASQPNGGGVASAPSSYTEARPSPWNAAGPRAAGHSAGSPGHPFGAGVTADRAAEGFATRAGSVGTGSGAPGFRDVAAVLEQVKADPRCSGEKRMQLGYLWSSSGFSQLDAAGKMEALKLFQADLDDLGALRNVRQIVNSLGTVKTQEDKRLALEVLTRNSPMTQQDFEIMRDLLRHNNFIQSPPDKQRQWIQDVGEAIRLLKALPPPGLTEPQLQQLVSIREQATKIFNDARRYRYADRREHLERETDKLKDLYYKIEKEFPNAGDPRVEKAKENILKMIHTGSSTSNRGPLSQRSIHSWILRECRPRAFGGTHLGGGT